MVIPTSTIQGSTGGDEDDDSTIAIVISVVVRGGGGGGGGVQRVPWNTPLIEKNTHDSKCYN